MAKARALKLIRLRFYFIPFGMRCSEYTEMVVESHLCRECRTFWNQGLMLFPFTLAAIKISLMIRIVQSGKQDKKGPTWVSPRDTRKMKPRPMPLSPLSWGGDVSGVDLCLKLELECLFGSELSNTLKELLITCCMSADFTSHKVSGVTSRGSL